MRSLSAEFPNDNPALHRGAIWVCAEIGAAPIAECPAPEIPEPPVETVEAKEEEAVAPPVVESGVVLVEAPEDPPAEIADEDDEEILVVDEIPPLEGVVETVANDFVPRESMEVPKAPDDPFTTFACAMVDVAIGAGSPIVASLLPRLLEEGQLGEGLGPEALAALEGAGVLDGSGAVTETFVAVTNAWKAILRGTSDDFSACGGAMLDEWASDLLARLLGAADRGAQLRRELRNRGVAAFGLIEAA